MKRPLLALGVVPFLMIAIHFKNPLALIIFINGVLCHGVGNRIFQVNDIACNALLIAYAGMFLFKMKYVTFLPIFFSAFLLSHVHNSDMLHLLGVQLPIAYIVFKSLQEKQHRRKPLEPSPLTGQPLI